MKPINIAVSLMVLAIISTPLTSWLGLREVSGGAFIFAMLMSWIVGFRFVLRRFR